MKKGYVYNPEKWLELIPDIQSRAELKELIERSQTDPEAQKELDDRFSSNLSFGTAGLRAAMDAGPNRMNRLVVRKAAAGIAQYANSKADHVTAVIGFDARHNSKIFAQESAAILTAAGIETFIMPRELPTPLLAYTTRNTPFDIGIMVTASHNPAADNGYKVYLGGQLVDNDGKGAQIVPPYDKEIAACIDGVDISNIAMADTGWKTIDEKTIDAYLSRVASLVEPQKCFKDLNVVYTAMHGVGAPIMSAILEKAGFSSVTHVAAQDTPDANFPTVDFPNPEEKGALNLAMVEAKKQDADIIIAHDPDADRAAVALPGVDGIWTMLRGDQLGTILGWSKLKNSKQPQKMVLANSIVSSRMLATIAQDFGARHQETLTGFKWISRVPKLDFGYEEALGYCVDPDYVHDKDGSSALLLALQCAAELKQEGKTLWDLLDELYKEYGLFATDQLSIRVEQLSDIQNMMKTLRSQGLTRIAGCDVVESLDLNHPQGNLPATDALVYICDNNTRIIVRPSGTEPKLKCYLEVVIDPKELTGQAAQDEAQARLDKVKTELAKTLGVA
ncbi:MAG: phospho-sugar mutase [Micrococcaceae bacterium]